MRRVLTIKGRTGLFDVPSFTLAKNEDLIVSVEIPDEHRIGAFRLIVSHDGKEQAYLVGKDITIPHEWINQDEGDLYFSLVFLNPTETKVVKDDYKIEPLKYEHVHGNFAFSSQVQKIQSYLDTIYTSLKKIENRVDKLTAEGVPLLPATDILENQD